MARRHRPSQLRTRYVQGMTDDRDSDDSPGVLDSLLSPLRLPGRVVADIEALARAARSLSDNASGA